MERDRSSYGSITLKKEFKEELKEEAKKQGLTVPAFLQVLLNRHKGGK